MGMGEVGTVCETSYHAHGEAESTYIAWLKDGWGSSAQWISSTVFVRRWGRKGWVQGYGSRN